MRWSLALSSTQVFDLLQDEHCLQRAFHARVGPAQFIHRYERNDAVGDDEQEGEQQSRSAAGMRRRACDLAVIVSLMLQPATGGSPHATG